MLDVHPTWRPDVEAAYAALDADYRRFVESAETIPERGRIFNAFRTLPKSEVRYILFGQDPYPRRESATGHAFIDGAVDAIFSETGLSKAVNRATSLRNFIKMALVAEGLLSGENLSQEAIGQIDKSALIATIDDLRENFEANGVLLLNAALVFEQKRASGRHAKAWQPFIRSLLSRLNEDVELILFGSIAKTILKIPETSRFGRYRLEHPYNHTFILNETAHRLFGPMHLLRKNRKISD
ncbi:uracil-DNA glycosylase [Hydrogenimonas urashimensis]|uniref:uracil-DNA glycosylase n=1 Tax=Hydrogenimonas urashimensis TaxID=2740515 RepID=UPI001915F02C|nr:uracil-DNA glycosylase [Hydrogenimonas urashimensis]